MDIMYILLPLNMLLFLQFITQIQLAESLFQVPFLGKFPLFTHQFLKTKLPTIYQCIELCVVYKLCRNLSYDRKRGKCELLSEDYDRQSSWKSGYEYTTMSKINIPPDIGGSCRGHTCAIDEMCMQAGLTYTCVRHDFSTVKCQETWGHIRDICYQVFFQKKTWSEAKDYCVSIGGEMLMMESWSEYRYHRRWINFKIQDEVGSSTVAGYIWTGIPYSASLPEWITLTSAATSRPNLCMGLMYNKTGELGSTLKIDFWEVVSCDIKNGFACQLRAPDQWQ